MALDLPKHGVMKQIMEILTRAGKVPVKCTGKIMIIAHVNEGGITDADLSVTEKIK